MLAARPPSISTRSNTGILPAEKPVRTIYTGTLDFRRLKLRQGWQPPEDPDADVFIFPNQRLGNNYDLNWRLNKYNVTPRADAFRNLHVRGLLMFTSGRKDSVGALHIPARDDIALQPYIAQSKVMPAGSTAKVLETEQWRSLLREVRLYLSDVDRLFVHDGAVGAFPGTATKVQVIGDDAISALFFAHTLQTTPLGDAFHFTPDLTVYFVANRRIQNVEGAGLARPDDFVAANLETGEVVVQTQSPAAMLGALLSVATARALEAKREQVPVAGSVLETPASSALLVPPPHEQAAPAVPPAQLHSAGHAILSSEGLTAAWRGFSARGLSEADWPLRRGDLVEEDAAGRPVRITSNFDRALASRSLPHPPAPRVRPNLLASPSAVVFLSPQGPAKPTRLSEDEIAKHIAAAIPPQLDWFSARNDAVALLSKLLPRPLSAFSLSSSAKPQDVLAFVSTLK